METPFDTAVNVGHQCEADDVSCLPVKFGTVVSWIHHGIVLFEPLY